MTTYVLRNGNVCARRVVDSDAELELLDIIAALREPDWCHGRPCYTRMPKPEYL